MKLLVKKLYPDSQIPKYNHETDAGMDVYAYTGIELEPFVPTLVKTGIALDIPEGYEVQVRPRSGLALKNNITVLNSPGTIDSGYRNEVGVILINFSKSPYQVFKGDRIAQLVFSQFTKAELNLVENFSGETERNLNGFGASGK